MVVLDSSNFVTRALIVVVLALGSGGRSFARWFTAELVGFHGAASKGFQASEAEDSLPHLQMTLAGARGSSRFAWRVHDV